MKLRSFKDALANRPQLGFCSIPLISRVLSGAYVAEIKRSKPYRRGEWRSPRVEALSGLVKRATASRPYSFYVQVSAADAPLRTRPWGKPPF